MRILVKTTPILVKINFGNENELSCFSLIYQLLTETVNLNRFYSVLVFIESIMDTKTKIIFLIKSNRISE